MKLPALQQGRSYSHDEVMDYLAPGDPYDDFIKAAHHWVPKDLSRGATLHGADPMRVEYALVKMNVLEGQIRELIVVFRPREDHWGRVQVILGLLRKGESALPVFIPTDDPDMRIMEGMHRAVALYLHGADSVPVFLMR